MVQGETVHAPGALLGDGQDRQPEHIHPLYQEFILSRLDPLQVAQELGQGSILLCWEKPGEFCHRIVVADWLREAGIEVEEYEEISVVRKRGSERDE